MKLDSVIQIKIVLIIQCQCQWHATEDQSLNILSGYIIYISVYIQLLLIPRCLPISTMPPSWSEGTSFVTFSLADYGSAIHHLGHKVWNNNQYCQWKLCIIDYIDCFSKTYLKIRIRIYLPPTNKYFQPKKIYFS